MIRRAFRIRHHIATASAFAWVSLMTSPAWASGSSMPWEAPSDPDRVRPVDCFRRVELLPVVLQLRRGGAGLMAVSFEALDTVPGFAVPVHRALTEPILLGGAPRSVAILNGTLAGAVGLGSDPTNLMMTGTVMEVLR